MNDIAAGLAEAAKKLFDVQVQPELSRPAEEFGDYSTNMALQLAGQLGKKPVDIAAQLEDELKLTQVTKIEVAGNGFLNFWLDDKLVLETALGAAKLPHSLAGQEILVEFGDPNPFKQMHIGHLYSYIVGDAISNLLQTSGAEVKRLSYHGDVGLHVAKAVFGLQELGKTEPGGDTIDEENFLGKAYAYGAQKYEEDPAAKQKIDDINLHIYKADDADIIKLYEEGVKLSFDYFDKVLDLLGIKNDKRYLESQTLEIGQELVEKNIGKVFTKSQGAVVYEGEKAGLHTRVFITSAGLPTYETKDLGLTELKDKDYPDANRSIIITAHEQAEYFKVMLAALAEIDENLAKKTTHLSHGFLSLATGKMSSRSGDVYPAMELLLQVKKAVHEQYSNSDTRKPITFGAVKYAFAKHRLGSDIVVDINESISLDGNSGPYLQYAHARAASILTKASKNAAGKTSDLETSERSLARKISEFPEVVTKATAELMPHHIATYLYELAQSFNSFYEANRVVDDPRQAIRLQLVKAYADVLKAGLGILGIEAPERV